MYASSTSSSSPSTFSPMFNYIPLPSAISRPPLGDGARSEQEHAKFTFPTILIIVTSVILFFVFMYFYLAPIIRDPNVVAPNSTKRLQLRARDVEVWHKCRGSPQPLVGDVEKAIPVSSPSSPELPNNRKRKRGLFRLFRRKPTPSDTHTPNHAHLGTHTHSQREFSLFSPSPSSADPFPTQLALPLPSPAYFPNAAAEAAECVKNAVEYRLPSPPQSPRTKRFSHEYADPTKQSICTYIRRQPASPPSSPKSPTPSPLSKVLCKRDSSSTINSLARIGGASTSGSTSTSSSTGSGSILAFLNTPPSKYETGSGKISPAPSVHSMLCR